METLIDRRWGKIEAPVTAKGMMPTTNSNTPTAHAKTVSKMTMTPVTEPSLAASTIMVVVFAETMVEVEVEHEAVAVAVAMALAVESERRES